MPRAGLSREAVVDLALAVVEEEGSAALTLAAVAGRAGVATPSLYKHVKNLSELRILVSARVIDELAARTSEAVLGRSGDDAVRALMQAYRRYVVESPNRYAALMQKPHPELAESGQRLLDAILAALRWYELEGSDVIHAARCLRSAAHGFAELEASGGFQFPEKLDESYEFLTHMIISGLPREIT